jgi:PAS domain S-box-containing protein
MTRTTKSGRASEFAHADLTRLSAAELQEQLETYFAQHDHARAQQLVQELLHELQEHQIVLEMQNQELRESQHQLEEARDRYADLYDFAPVCYITFDATGCIREINLTGAALLGQERASLISKPFSLYLNKESQPAFFKHLRQVRDTSQVVTIELQLKPVRGESVDVRLETIANVEMMEGKPSYRCVVINISARKQAEREIQHRGQQLRLLTDAIPTFIAYVDQQERYQFVNKVYEAWYQQSREQIVGKTVREVLGETTYAEIADYVRTALAGTTVNFEVSYPVPGGEERQFNASYIPDFADDGTVLGYFTMVQDVTDLRRHELLDKMHLLETARVARVNTMGEMVAEIAHELNQPLAAITIYSGAVSRMLRKDVFNVSEMQKALNEIRLQAERASEVISRLREFVSKRELKPESVQINDLVREVMTLLAVEARWHGVEVKLDLAQQISTVSVDRILIEQVILNLARNAIEAMDAIEQGERRLAIKTTLGNHNEIELAVEDSGPGLAIAEMENIFEPFHTSKPQGMGMGLAISRSIIKAHHGRLWAIPNECGGTTFTFTLLAKSETESE